MRIFGLDITRARPSEKALSPVGNERGGWFRVLESFAGAWQSGVTVNYDSVLSHSAVYACATLIASDIAKLRVKLVEKTPSGIWEEVENPAYSPVLRKPNEFQTRIQFWECWMLSKLLRGNTYVLKQRNGNGNVIALYVLDSSPG
jgi:phage portal protein BeeE